METRFAGHVAVVTGSGSGLGAAVAKRLAAEGAPVAGLDLNLAAAEATAKEIVDGGGTARAYEVNVANEGSVVAAVDASTKMRRMADVRGDGDADNVEIQWVIDSLPD